MLFKGEKEFSKIENKCSIILNNIHKSKDNIEIKKDDLHELGKFLYIMMYRKESRKNQYIEKRFDNNTKDMLDSFMNKHKINNYEDVWLNNIKELLKTNHNQIQYNNKIFPSIRCEYIEFMKLNFICIWEAKNSEFIISSKCFGIHEGKLPLPYHVFFVISPKHVIVFSENSFLTRNNNNSMFPNNIHSKVIEENESFIVNIKQINKEIVYLVNSLFLEEENKSITFISHLNLYKSILNYEKNNKLILQRNYNFLKDIIKSNFNNSKLLINNPTKDFPYDHKIDKKDIFNILNYFKDNDIYIFNKFKFFVLMEMDKYVDNNDFLNIMLEGLPVQVELNNCLILDIKKIIEEYLINVNIVIYLYDTYRKLNKFLSIPFVNIIIGHLDKDTYIKICYFKSDILKEKFDKENDKEEYINSNDIEKGLSGFLRR